MLSVKERSAVELSVLSAFNEIVPDAVSGETEIVAPGQIAAPIPAGSERHACLMVQSPTRSPPQGVTVGQVEPLLPAPALLSAPPELEPEAAFEPATPGEPEAAFE